MKANALSAGLVCVPDKRHMLSPHFSHHLRFQAKEVSHVPLKEFSPLPGDLHGDTSNVLLSGKMESQVHEL